MAIRTKDPEHKAICTSVAAGVTYVVAAGNDANDASRFTPAAYDEVITVSAMSDTDGQPGELGGLDACGDSQTDDVFATFSNFGADIDIAAPGVCVQSTFNGGSYAHGSGTSFAAPAVSGTVALCIASGPCGGLTPAQITQKIVADAAAYNNAHPEYGFVGDPLRPVAGKYFGYLIRAALY